jgi:Putative zinc-finger
MQEFAQKDSTTPTGHCPSAEDLAAYIDGNLGKEEGQRIIEHLASCEDCYAVYTETLRFQLDTESVFSEGEVLPFRVSKEKGTVAAALRRWYPIAALLLVGVGSGTYFQLLMPPPGLVTTRLTPFPPSAEQLWLGPTYRGEGGDEEAKLDEAAFRMGVQLVNLQASLKSGNVLAAQDVVARILGLLKAQPFTDDLQKGYTGITIALEDHDLAPGESGQGLSLPHDRLLRSVRTRQENRTVKVLPEAHRLSKESREVFDPTPLDLGQWVEAGHLAALAHNPSFFQQPDTQSFLRRLRWREKLGMGDTKFDQPTRESLDQISEIASKDDLQASDYAELQRQFEKILGIYYPET